MKDRRKRILFLCTGNSCRSQMAEAFAKYYHSDWLEAYSAGMSPQGVDPHAVRAMEEAGIDISTNISKSLNLYENMEFDYVITLCDSALKACPVFGGKGFYMHIPFDDPPLLSKDFEDEEDIMKHYRRVRDEIREFVKNLSDLLKGS